MVPVALRLASIDKGIKGVLVFVYVCMCMYLCMYVHAGVCVCVCVCICMYVYFYVCREWNAIFLASLSSTVARFDDCTSVVGERAHGLFATGVCKPRVSKGCKWVSGKGRVRRGGGGGKDDANTRERRKGEGEGGVFEPNG